MRNPNFVTLLSKVTLFFLSLGEPSLGEPNLGEPNEFEIRASSGERRFRSMKPCSGIQ